jgi:hypothetical protein
MRFIKISVLAVFCVALFSVCKNGASQNDGDYSAPAIIKKYPDGEEARTQSDSGNAAVYGTDYETAVHKADFSNGDCTITLYGLTDQSVVYLVKVNTGGSPVDGDATGHVISWQTGEDGETQNADGMENRSGLSSARLLSGAASSAFGVSAGGNGRNKVPYDPVGKINKEVYDAVKNGRLVWGEKPQDGVSGNGVIQGRALSGAIASARDTTLITSKSLAYFYVLDENRESRLFLSDLAAESDHCKVWVIRENDGAIPSYLAGSIAAKFDQIYGYETDVFGFEYGGGVPGDPAYGGIDNDPKIQILIYYDDKEGGDKAGYFFSADEFRQSDLDSAGLSHIKSNEAEIFYINAAFADADSLDVIYSTLVHEFQHMIHFNRKTMSNPGRPVSASWFNEMLSMVAEDLIDPLIGIDKDNIAHPVKDRIPLFLEYYNYADPTVWLDGDDTLMSYSASYALGAYLVRNFGGVDLVKELISNRYVDIDAIDTALRSDANPNKSVTGFTQALSRFGEALLFNSKIEDGRSSGVLSFNKDETGNAGGTSCIFLGFDIYTIRGDTKFPYIWDTDKTYSLHPRTLILQTDTAWQYREEDSGFLSITLSAPAASSIDTYIIVK